MNEYAFGHIAAKYALTLLSENLVKQMIEKSSKVELAMLDSGMKGHERKRVEVFLVRQSVRIE
jgi:D-tyrosyl-tRNA(Tyr) deacylase